MSVPGLTPVATAVESIDAIDPPEVVVQVSWFVRSLLVPFRKVPLAVYEIKFPTFTVAVAGVTIRDTRTGAHTLPFVPGLPGTCVVAKP